MAAALPPLDPPGARSKFPWIVGYAVGRVFRRGAIAKFIGVVLPRINAPAASKRSITVALKGGISFPGCASRRCAGHALLRKARYFNRQ
jgi:hypothetical protein